MATSPSVCSVPRAASPSLQTETKPWPCYSAAQTKPWPSCSPASTRPSTKLLWKISTRTKSTRPPDILLNLASVHFLPSWTLEITHILSQYGLLRTLTKHLRGVHLVARPYGSRENCGTCRDYTDYDRNARIEWGSS